MDRQYYLYLITDTYFHTKNPVASEPTEPNYNLQIKLFREIFVRKQKVAEREDFVTKDEFLLQCALALDEIKEYINTQIFLEIGRLHSEKESVRTFWIDINGSVGDIPKSVVDDTILRVQKSIDDFDENNFLVDLSGLGGIIKGEICNYDVMLIEEVFEELNIVTDQQPEPEPLDLSDSKPLEKIALLYELGIINYLHTKDGKPHTVNSIATVLSGITGIRANTIQSAINPFINTHSTSKGKPADSTILKAKKKLIDLGF